MTLSIDLSESLYLNKIIQKKLTGLLYKLSHASLSSQKEKSLKETLTEILQYHQKQDQELIKIVNKNI